jgi:hypothetical protein
MENKNYLMIEENVVTNILVWNGDTSQWTPPSTALMLVQATTLTKVWKLNTEKTDYELVDSVGDACIGFIYDGSVCITNEEKPVVIPQDSPTPATGEIPVTNTGE